MRGCAPRASRKPARPRSGDSMIVMRSPSKKTLHATEQDRPDITAARALKAEQSSLNEQRLVFINETAVTTKMVRHCGFCGYASSSQCGEAQGSLEIIAKSA